MRRAAEKLHIVAARARAVGEKHQIELRGFRSLGEFHVMPEIHTGVGLRFGMTPCCDMVACRIEKSAKAQMAAALGHDDGF